MGSKTPKAPKPSPQELSLIAQQSEQVRLGNMYFQTQMQQQQEDRGYQTEQNRRMDLLQPLLYQQMGITPRYENGQIVGYDRTPGGTAEEQQYQQEMALYRQQMGLQERQMTAQEAQMAGQQEQYNQQMELYKQQMGLQEQQMGYQTGAMQRAEEAQKQQFALTQEQTRLQNLLTPMQLEAAGYQATYDEAGKMTGIAKKALTPEQLQEQDLRTQMNQRSLDALQGKLPVDAQLTDQLSQQEAQLHETLRRQLGEGYATSTPGIQALAEWGKQKAMVMEGARKGELTLNEQLSLGRQTQQDQRAGTTLGDLGAIGQGGRNLIGAYSNTQANPTMMGQPTPPQWGQIVGQASGVGSPGAVSGGYLGAVRGGRTLGQMGGGMSMGGGGADAMGLIQYLGQQRQQDFMNQGPQRNRLRGAMGGMAGGAAAGSTIGPWGTVGGAAIGGLMGAFL